MLSHPSPVEVFGAISLSNISSVVFLSEFLSFTF